MARAPVSKTGGWGFESLHSCQAGIGACAGKELRLEQGGSGKDCNKDRI